MIINIIGWFGTILILLAYYLSTEEKIIPNSYIHLSLNSLGAIGVGILVFNQEAWPVLFLQIVWLFIALKGFYNKHTNIEQSIWNP